MTKREINVFDYANEILSKVRKGIILVSKSGEKVNAMTIGWGSIGVEWNKPIFTVYVRTGRYTAELLNNSDSFTVCVPDDNSPKSAIGLFGNNSGRDIDKVKESGLTFIPGEAVDSPAIKEFPLVIECKIAHHQVQDKAVLGESYMDMYPEDKGSENSGRNRDPHIAFIGEIVKAYIIED